ncbi:MAG: HD domain-containing protein [Ignavibacteria bacterium]|jgi:(p)ppGpp synthase/HD superfamily hydrolase|nr:HD domain-containing protein [Ignavibacteria bacterium]
MDNDTGIIELYDEAITGFGIDYDDDLSRMLAAIDKYKLDVDVNMISNAFDLCYNSHQGVKRMSGVPYYTHPLAVAMILIEELNISDTAVIVATLLHNVLRDNLMITYDYIVSHFGKDVATLLFHYSKFVKHISADKNIQNKKTRAEIYLQLFMLIIRDARTFIIQLCNRLHDLRTLQYLPKEKQTEIADETLNFYVPFASQFGFHKIQAELERRAFYFYDSNQYHWIMDYLKVKKKIFTEYLFLLVDSIKNFLITQNIHYNIEVLHKQEYEIFLLLQSGQNINDIDNIFSLNVILDTEDVAVAKNVYDLLLSNLQKNDFIDIYNKNKIAPDGSMLLDLIDSNGKTQIAIKMKNTDIVNDSQIMKTLAENKYRHNYLNISDEDVELWANWMKHIIDTKNPIDAEQILWNSIKNNLYNNAIVVYNKKGEVVSLPNGSSVIDFAFELSQDIGLSTITCKVDGNIKDIFYELKDGEKVEIITSPKCYPDSNWLHHIITFKAFAHLTNYFKHDFILNEKKYLPERPKRQIFRISSVKHNNILIKVKDIIGQEHIHRIYLGYNLNTFNIAVHTTFIEDDITNNIFLKLIGINGVKSLSIDSIAI